MFDSVNQKMVTFVLDGEEVSVPEDSTIWEAANGRGIQIPYLCHKPEPGYRSDGN
jgi:formate dehydrogenase major subunit